ncbi:MAG: hypothetical protein U1F18_08035 [Steroidobacteraceae bacterium]
MLNTLLCSPQQKEAARDTEWRAVIVDLDLPRRNASPAGDEQCLAINLRHRESRRGCSSSGNETLRIRDAIDILAAGGRHSGVTGCSMRVAREPSGTRRDPRVDAS